MDFHSIILKNIKYNIRNYTAFLLGNTLLQCILFMFFTLVFSPSFITENSTLISQDNINSFIAIMVIFSIVFIIYSTVSFTKYRGKEFGVYFTIGLTTKEILKLLCFEDFIIALSSYVLSIISGSIFSKLFHMAIGKILDVDIITLSVTAEAFLLTALISVLIFVISMVYQLIYLKRYSVLDILKSKQVKAIGASNFIAGIAGIIIFIISLVIFKKVVNQEVENTNIAIMISVCGLGISLYLLIGYVMTVVVKVLKRFKSIYNKQILFLNSLSHRFMNFRIVLFVVTLMVIGAVTFLSMAYSVYDITEMSINREYPYDVSFVVEKADLNEEKIKKVVEESSEGEIKDFKVLDVINTPIIDIIDGEVDESRANHFYMSEDGYNKLTNNNISLGNNDIVILHEGNMNANIYRDAILPLDTGLKKQGVSIEDIKKDGNDKAIYVPSENKTIKSETIINYIRSKEYSAYNPYVLNNNYYERMKNSLGEESVVYDVLINLKDNEKYENIREAVEKSYGKKAADSVSINREEFKENLKRNSFSLFMSAFLGMMFFIGSAAVLYFKTMTSVEEDRERSKSLKNIGLTSKEVNKLLNKELGAVFIVPPIIALFITGYILRTIYNIMNEGDNMWQSTLSVFAVYLVIQIVFFILTSKKYKRILG